jgi:hypothetical protein
MAGEGEKVIYLKGCAGSIDMLQRENQPVISNARLESREKSGPRTEKAISPGGLAMAGPRFLLER